jgi:predicted ATPase
MLDSLHIQRFRGFEDLQLVGLGSVNLLVGKNNIGKTTILEAIKMRCAGTGAIEEMGNLLGSRQEIQRELSAEGEARQQWDIDRLFFCPPNGTGQPLQRRLSIGPVGAPQSTLTIELAWVREVRHDTGEITRQVLTEISEPQNDQNIFEAVIVNFGPSLRRIYIPDRIFRWDRPPSRPRTADADKGQINCHYVPARGFTGREAGDLWDRVVLTDLESDVLNALRIIDPTIERISLIKSEARMVSRVALIRRSGRGSPEPLNSLGDGMIRVFEMALGLANSKGGILLVDEFENGVHYSVQRELWSFIFEVASRLQSQVFAATHSWDCIAAFQEAASAHPDEGALIGLYQRDNKISATVFDERRLEIVTKESIEVR